MGSNKPHSRVWLFDVVWVVVAAAAAVGLGTGILDFLSSAIRPNADGMGLLLAGFVVVALWGVMAWWIGMGAWRRTSWGCTLDAEADGQCPRHGRHCDAAGQSQTLV